MCTNLHFPVDWPTELWGDKLHYQNNLHRSATETLYPIMLLYYESFRLSPLAGHPGLATNASPSPSHEVTRLFFPKTDCLGQRTAMLSRQFQNSFIRSMKCCDEQCMRLKRQVRRFLEPYIVVVIDWWAYGQRFTFINAICSWTDLTAVNHFAA